MENPEDTAEATALSASPLVASIKLDEPIRRGETSIDRVLVRRPTPGQMEGVSLRDVINLDVGASLTLLARITEPALVRHELATMDPSDFTTLAVEVSNFLLPKSARHPPLTE